MSSLLRRSKSTRDARAKVTRDQLDFNFATEIGPTAAAAVAVTVAVAAATKAEALEPTTTKLLKLARRKSVSSIHTTLKIAQITNNLPKTADPRNRQSILYKEEEETSPVPPLPAGYETRSSSNMSNYGMEPDMVVDDAECCVIGMAIGSPTEIIAQQPSSRSEKLEIPVHPTHTMYSTDAGTSSTSKLPDRRFGVQVRGPVASGARRGALLHKERERERDKEREKEKDHKNGHQQEEPSRTGWRKMFSKSFFGNRKSSPKQQPEPATKKLELVTRDKLSPHVVPKVHKPRSKKNEASPAPCLNVDIPEVEMERYSVMFGTLLHPSEKSTIFARRKSRDAASRKQTATEAKRPSQLYLTPLKRNATTGQVCRSPGPMRDASPLPSAASGSSRTSSPSCLTRSKTTTEGSPSLSPQTVYMVRAHTSKEAQNDCVGTPGSLLRPRSSSKVSKISEESSIDTPRGSFDEGDDEWLTKEDDGEPQWEMVTPGGKSPKEPMSEAQIETAAQISIARQISISQRQLLIPIVPRSQRLVSRGQIRKALVNPKLPVLPSEQLQPQSEQQPEDQEQPEQPEQPEQDQNSVPGLAR